MCSVIDNFFSIFFGHKCCQKMPRQGRYAFILSTACKTRNTKCNKQIKRRSWLGDSRVYNTVVAYVVGSTSLLIRISSYNNKHKKIDTQQLGNKVIVIIYMFIWFWFCFPTVLVFNEKYNSSISSQSQSQNSSKNYR